MRMMAAAGSVIMATMSLAPAAAQMRDGPAITGYGKTFPTDHAMQRPDSALRYRVLFSITKAASSPDKVDPSLEKVARFVNLLAIDGVKPLPGDVVAIVHGAATPVVLDDAAYARRAGAKTNPNLDLIAKLQAAGVTIAVCDQALGGQGATKGDLASGVRIDVSALTTLATLQLRGWALIPD